jgi:hypothetical protein
MRPLERYQVGERLMLPLNRRPERWSEGHAAPKEAAAARWVNHFRYPYDKQVQSEHFRTVAGVWRDPAAHLEDPKLRDDALFFLALQMKFSEKLLQKLLGSMEVADQRAGCMAARIVRSRVALEPLVAIVEARGAQIAAWKGEPESDENRKERREVEGLYEEARWAIQELPIDGQNDGPVLLRLALSGGMTESMTVKLLHAGPARWEVTRGLVKELKARPTVEAAAVLQALDPRAAYDPIRLLAMPRSGERSYEAGRLVNEYHTLWAMRYVLDHAYDQVRGRGAYEEFYYVLGSFGFTHGPVEPRERQSKDGKSRGWEALYAELRKTALVQLDVAEKNGPSFAQLPKHLKRCEHVEVHTVGGKDFVTLNQSQHGELMRLILRHAEVKAVRRDARAPAAWVVDLYYPALRHLPIGQLWVAADGTFGLSWLPDRAWGRAPELAAWLTRVAKK